MRNKKNMKIFSRLFFTAFFTTALSILTSITVFAAGTTPAISTATYKTGVAKIVVTFNVPTWGDSGLTTALNSSDFQLGGTCGFSGSATITNVTYGTAGSTWALLTIAGMAGATETSCTVAAKANSIFTVGGALSEKTVALVSDTTGPTVTGPGSGIGKYVTGSQYVLIMFNEPVFGDSAATTALDYNDIAYTDAANAGCQLFTDNEVTVAGGDFIIEKCDNVSTVSDTSDTFDFASGAVYDALGNASTTGTSKAMINLQLGPNLTFSKVHTGDAAAGFDTCVGCGSGLVKYSFPAFNTSTPSMGAALQTSDFSYTDTGGGGKTIQSVSHLSNMEWTMVSFTAVFTAADLTTATADTITRADSTSIYDPWGRSIDTATLSMVDNTNPVILSISKDFGFSHNLITITYSENVKIGSLDSASESMVSTSSIGDTTTAGTIAGFGSFATTGDVTVATTKNTALENGDVSSFTIIIAAQSGSYMTPGSSTEPSGVFTPNASGTYVTDFEPNTGNGIASTSIQSTITSTAAWDLTPPSQITGFNYSNNSDTGTTLVWTPYSVLADFSRYLIAYKTSTGVGLSDSLWTTSNASNLATITTASTLITGLSKEITHYAKIYGIDASGNVSTESAEKNWYIAGAGGGGSQESTPAPAQETAPSKEAPPKEAPPKEVPPKKVLPKKDSIAAMIKAGIFKAKADGTFEANKAMNRAEVATVFYRVLGLVEPPASPKADPYSDVSKNQWYAGYVQKMKDMKFLSNKVNTYGPEVFTTKAEFLRFAMNVYILLVPQEIAEIKALGQDKSNIKFDDVSIDAWYASDVAAAGAKGFLEDMGTECKQGTCFLANETITRGNATGILYNMFGKILGVAE